MGRTREPLAFLAIFSASVTSDKQKIRYSKKRREGVKGKERETKG